jgi:hypothetical protein
MAMRSAISELGISPSLVVFGETLALPEALTNPRLTYNEQNVSDFVYQLTEELLTIRQYILENDKTLMGPSGDENDRQFDHKYVWVKQAVYHSSLHPKYSGPYEVVKVEYPVITIRKDNELRKVNVDRLRPAFRLSENIRITEIEDNVIPQQDTPVHIRTRMMPFVGKKYIDVPEVQEMLPDIMAENDILVEDPPEELEVIHLQDTVMQDFTDDEAIVVYDNFQTQDIPVPKPRMAIHDRIHRGNVRQTGSGRAVQKPTRWGYDHQ